MPTGEKIKSFRDRFSQLVEESGKTITEIAKELHVSGQTVSAWKLGVRSPKEPTIISIANYFNVNVKWLMGFDVPRDAYEEYYFEWKQAQDKKEIRIVSGMMEKMTQEQQEQVVNVIRAMFANHPELLK